MNVNFRLLVSGRGSLQKGSQGRCLRCRSLVTRKGLALNAAISRARMDLHSAWRDVARFLRYAFAAVDVRCGRLNVVVEE